MQNEVIVAIASGQGNAGVGIIRISGANDLVLKLAQQLISTNKISSINQTIFIKPRYAHYRNFYDANEEIIDSGLILYFPVPHSYTGDTVIEIQGHGGRVVLQMLLQRCLQLGARLAEPGEFSRRAFINGKLDLTQVEAIADLINASSATAVLSAQRSLQGVFATEINQLVNSLIKLRLYVEANLDFPEEEIDSVDRKFLQTEHQTLSEHLQKVYQRAGQGKLLQTGAELVLIGQPNVGKSTLMNALAQDEVAIVSNQAGTTRDSLRTTLNISGVPFHLIDTAGIRESEEEIEQQGIKRSWRAIEKADIALVVYDINFGISSVDCQICQKIPTNIKILLLANKADLSDIASSFSPNLMKHDLQNIADFNNFPHQQLLGKITISAKYGDGVELLEKSILEQIGWQDSSDTFIARERHIQALLAAQSYLANAYQFINQDLFANIPLELFAEELRLCQEALGQITGTFTSDDLLGEIFSSFCIGK